MRSTYKRFVWRAPRPVNTSDCMNEWRYCLKCNKNISILTHLHSFIQSAMFTGRVARQTNRLYVLRMIVKLAYRNVGTCCANSSGFKLYTTTANKCQQCCGSMQTDVTCWAQHCCVFLANNVASVCMDPTRDN